MQRDNPLIGRREILKSVIAAPLALPSSIFGKDDAIAPSERVTIALIGCGGRGSADFKGLIAAGGQAIAACDPWQERREKWANQIGGTAYADFREMLARDDLDAVCIGSTDCWHVHHTVAAAKAGKDTYTEKPLGVSVAEDLKCREVIRRYERVFQYGTQQRSSDHCRFGCELVRSGYIGEVKSIQVIAPDSQTGNTGTEQPVPEGLDYDMWLGPAAWRPYCGQSTGGHQWWHDYNYALGFIAGWGAHPLDILQWGYDTHLTGPWEVEGTATIPTEGRNNVVMNWNVNFNFANGAKMNFITGGNYTQFTGTEGWVGISRGGIKADPPSLLDVKLKPDDVHLPTSKSQGGNFLESVQERRDAVSNIDDAVRSDTISHVSDIAIRCGRKVVWDPAAEDFVGDPQASRMLTRPHRGPWTL